MSEVTITVKGDFTSSRFQYDGDNSPEAIDDFLEKVIKAVQHERDQLSRCPLHRNGKPITRGRAAMAGPNLTQITRAETPKES